MVKIINNLNSKCTTELGNLDYGDFFELDNTVYQFLCYSDTSLVIRNIETGKIKYVDKTTVVCKLDATIIIDGYSKEE